MNFNQLTLTEADAENQSRTLPDNFEPVTLVFFFIAATNDGGY